MAGTKKVALVATVESGSSRNHFLSASATTAVFFLFFPRALSAACPDRTQTLFSLFFLYLQWLHKNLLFSASNSQPCTSLSRSIHSFRVRNLFFFSALFFSPLVCHLLPRCFLSAWKMRRSAPDHTEHKTLLAPLSDGKQLGLDMDNCEREKSSQLFFFFKLL